MSAFQCRPNYTNTLLGFRARWIDGDECGLFSIHAPLGQTTVGYAWDEYLYGVLEEVEDRVTVYLSVCAV